MDYLFIDIVRAKFMITFAQDQILSHGLTLFGSRKESLHIILSSVGCSTWTVFLQRTTSLAGEFPQTCAVYSDKHAMKQEITFYTIAPSLHSCGIASAIGVESLMSPLNGNWSLTTCRVFCLGLSGHAWSQSFHQPRATLPFSSFSLFYWFLPIFFIRKISKENIYLAFHPFFQIYIYIILFV